MRRIAEIAGLVLIILFSSCSEQEVQLSVNNGRLDSEGNKITVDNFDEKNSFDKEYANVSVVKNIRYKVDLMSALDFLERKNERPSKEDRADLEKEAVLILEIWANEGVKEIFESKELTLNKDDAIQYLMGQIGTDLTLYQGKKEFTSSAIQYDGNLSGANKIRVFFFFDDLNTSKETTIKYYDRLFGAGLINLKQKEK